MSVTQTRGSGENADQSDAQSPSVSTAEFAAKVRLQASAYFTAVYGPDVAYRAPETFSNLVERWIWCVAAAEPDAAGEVMAEIKRQAEARRATGGTR